MVKIEIDGKIVEARPGQMLIEAADEVGIQIPRFCYHKKLSIAANCRMCLVDVANAPKPLPACATPVSDGMKVFTKSDRAVDAQKAVMEFLLINHPLDCPICDQGGQCELQDVALEYGKDASRFVERKRSVKDKNIGPLISTEMTRCIHCTRCVRFGSEIAGNRELGATGRGEFMEIGTYIEKSVNSEVSGNVIDLCPVGALTSKPFRFKARAWEIQSKPSISPHDCVGSHLFFHTLRNKVMRALPRENEALNEVWLSDRDRFSYEAFDHASRLKQPLIKEKGLWKEVDWETAIRTAIDKLQSIIQNEGTDAVGILASPQATLEEFYLLQKLSRHKGLINIDHRLRQTDFCHQAYLGSYPQLGISLSDLEHQNGILLVGTDVRKEQPIINLRLRKAALHHSAVFAISAWSCDSTFPLKGELVGEQGDIIQPLLEVIKAVIDQSGKEMQSQWPDELRKMMPSKAAKDIAAGLLAAEKKSLILGMQAWSHPQAHKIYWLSRFLAQLIGATWGEMSAGPNSAGAWLAGMVPHCLPMGQKSEQKGLTVSEMWEKPRSAYLLFQCEPEYDTALSGLAQQALKQAKAVIVMNTFDNPHIREYADVILPICPISETEGTYVNLAGTWQSFSSVVPPLENSKPGWKVLRVMANVWEVPGFKYETVTEVLAELRTLQSTQPVFNECISSTVGSEAWNSRDLKSRPH